MCKCCGHLTAIEARERADCTGESGFVMVLCVICMCCGRLEFIEARDFEHGTGEPRLVIALDVVCMCRGYWEVILVFETMNMAVILDY